MVERLDSLTDIGDAHNARPARADAPPESRNRQSRNLIPGESGVWVLLLSDLFQFTVFFALFSYHRGREREVFEDSARQLHLELGFTNTVILIVASVVVAVALRHWGHGATPRATSRLLFASAALAALFVVIKITEYILTAHAGYTIGTNDFFMFYFCVTGFHLVHAVAAGIALFFAARSVARGQAEPHSKHRGAVYSIGLLWHMVDLIWLVLFSLLYIS